MMMKKKNWFYLSSLGLCTLLCFNSCSDDDSQDPPVPTPPSVETSTTGVYILNTGKKGQNNASLSYYDFSTGVMTADIFQEKNNRALGDKAETMKLYGTKLYVTVYASNLIEVIDAATGRSVKTIPLGSEAETPQSPRCLAVHDGKVYVSMFNGFVSRLDTTTLEIDKSVPVGINPQGLTVANNKLYVAITKGLSGKKGTTLDVIDLNSFTLAKSVEVALNPQYVYTDSQQDVYVTSFGNYGKPAEGEEALKYVFQRLDTQTDQSAILPDLLAMKMEIKNDTAYIICNDFYSKSNIIYTYDLKNEKQITTNFITDGTELCPETSSVAGLGIDPVSGEVYVTIGNGSNNGDLSIYSRDGVFKKKIEVEVYPSDIAFVTKDEVREAN